MFDIQGVEAPAIWKVFIHGYPLTCKSTVTRMPTLGPSFVTPFPGTFLQPPQWPGDLVSCHQGAKGSSRTQRTLKWPCWALNKFPRETECGEGEGKGVPEIT